MSGVARTVWMFAKSPDTEGEYQMLRGKNNLSKKRTGLKYRFGDKTLASGITAPFIVWGEVTEGDADSVLQKENNPIEKQAARAERFLKDYLKDGARKSDELLADGKAQGIGRTTLFTAKKELGIRAEQRNREWWWKLPTNEDLENSDEYSNEY